MAINERGDNQQSSGTTQQPQQGFQQSTQSQQHSVFGPSLRSGISIGSPIGKGMGSEYSKKIKAKLDEIYKTASKDYELLVLEIDNTNQTGSYFSVLLVCVRMAGEKSTGYVAVHPLIVEDSADPIKPIYENINNTQVKITRTSGQALDAKLAGIITDLAKKAFPKESVILLPGEVIPRGFNPEDNTAAHLLAFNSSFACGTELMLTSKNFVDMDLTKEEKDSILAVNIGFMPTQIKNAVGEPMRSDVLVSLSSSKKNFNGDKNSINSEAREMPISELSAFIDLVWHPIVQQNAMGMMQHPMSLPAGVLPTQKYNARAVITNLAFDRFYTPACILLGLSMASSLGTDSNWMQAFRPSATAGDLDFHDIGAMNIEANLANETDKNGYGTRIDTKNPKFTLLDLGDFISRIVGQGLIVSLDCPEAGPQSWYLSMFSMAERGNQNAVNGIISAARRLTGDRFMQYYDDKQPMFVDTDNIVHLGYWTDRNGDRRDIRDVDTIFVANHVGERNPQIISEWQNTFLNKNFPLDQRLANRERLISAVTNETAVFTGFARRVTFSANFLGALSRGIQETGFMFKINTPLSSTDMQNQRGYATFAGAALLMPGQSLTSSVFGTTSQAAVGGYNFGGRY